MARNDEIPESTDFTKAVSAGIRRLMEQHNTTHEILAAAIGRSQSYVSLRARSMRSWTTDDLDAVAHYYKYAGAFAMIKDIALPDVSRKRVISVSAQEAEAAALDRDVAETLERVEKGMYGLAANWDPNKEKEQEDDY